MDNISYQSTEIINELKNILKKKRMTYLDLSLALDLSEVTVKRIFSEYKCSLFRLESICNVLEISIFDLIEFIKNKNESTFSFTLEQEKAMAKNIELFLFYDELKKNNLEFQETLDRLKISKAQAYKLIRKLEKLEILLLLPGDQIKFLNQGTLNFLHNGPLQNIMLKGDVYHLIDHGIKQLELHEQNENKTYLTMSTRKVSPSTLKKLESELSQTFQKLRNMAYQDEKMLSEDQLIDIEWLGLITPFPKRESSLKEKVSKYR